VQAVNVFTSWESWICLAGKFLLTLQELFGNFGFAVLGIEILDVRPTFTWR